MWLNGILSADFSPRLDIFQNHDDSAVSRWLVWVCNKPFVNVVLWSELWLSLGIRVSASKNPVISGIFCMCRDFDRPFEAIYNFKALRKQRN